MGSNPAGCTIFQKIPVKKRKSSLRKQVCRLFFFFLLTFVCFEPEGFFFVGCLCRQRLQAHFASLVSNPAGCTIFQKIPVKNQKAAYASKLARRFFLFYIFRLLRTRGIFYAGCRRFAPALGFASSNPVGCTIFQKIITPVATDSYSWCFFFAVVRK